MQRGYVCRGNGACFDGRWVVIHKYTASVDGEEFVIVRFADGREQLVSVDELYLPNEAPRCTQEIELETEEEEVVGEVEDPTTSELGSFSPDRENEYEEELEAEVAE